MVNSPLSAAFIPEADAAIRDLQRFGRVTAAPAPDYHGYLGVITNAAMSLLALCIHQTGTAVVFPGPLSGDQWEALVVMVHRAFYAGLLTAIEGMCDGFCKSRGSTVTASRPARSPEFMDYINSALGASRLNDARRTYWRRYFDAVRILRNKASHFSNALTPHERQTLQDAGLGHHITANDTVQTRPANYAPLAQRVLDFVAELERP